MYTHTRDLFVYILKIVAKKGSKGKIGTVPEW